MNDTQAFILQQPQQAAQLILLFHGVGATAQSMAPLGLAYAQAFPQAMVVALDSPYPSELAPGGRQWFSVTGITEENREQRVAAALPAFEYAVRYWQQRAGVDAAGTALVGFSQGAIMALASALRPEPVAARVIALAGRFAVLPEQPLHENCTVHLLHGKTDAVMPYRHAIEGAMRLRTLGADFTADVLPFVGHELHPELMALAVEKLQQHIPARLWLQPGETPD
ncbi:MAG: esterase [Burkholderiaceae bacterium]|nr:esterase [Burkholderiaceae bacterium]